MMLDVIKQQIAEGEGLHTKFLAQLEPDRVAELVCGFLNGQGGTIFCGVAEDGRVLGVPDAPGAQALLHQQRVARVSPSALFTISVDEVDGLNVLSIEVPEGKDRPYVSGSRGYTQAADVLLALNPAVRHPQTRVRVTRFADGKTGGRYLDDRQFQGPMVQVFNKVYGWINDQLPREERFEPGQVQRVARATYPAEAIREGLVNAFAHRDYAGFSGGLTVGVYNDRIEIWNAGRLPDGLTPGNLRRNHPSLPTNPDMAQVLYLRGLMERIGRGTQKILQACEAQGLRQPEWDDRATGVTLTLFGPAAADVHVQLNDRQRAVLDALDNALNNGETASLRPLDYRARFAQDVSERQARRDLDALEKLGLLRREGAGPSTVFVLISRP